MSVILAPNSYNVSATPVSEDNSDNTGALDESVFTYGLEVLFSFMDTMSSQANTQFASMKASSEKARDVQKYSGELDGILAGRADAGASDQIDVPDDIINFCNNNNISLSGFTKEDKDTYYHGNKGQLTTVKNALDNLANRSTDFVSTAQLQLQKQMQTYNVCVSLVNSMQSMLSEMNKTIAQGIR